MWGEEEMSVSKKIKKKKKVLLPKPESPEISAAIRRGLKFMANALDNPPYALVDTDSKEFFDEFIPEVPVVFVTPKELLLANMGFSPETFRVEGIGLEDWFQVSVADLYFRAKHYILGNTNGVEISLEVPWTDCVVNFVININGKYCKLNTDEWNVFNNFDNLDTVKQVCLYQRLLSQRIITMHDLEVADISNDVYKQLYLNQEMGDSLFAEKLNYIRKWYKRQFKDAKLLKLVERYKLIAAVHNRIDENTEEIEIPEFDPEVAEARAEWFQENIVEPGKQRDRQMRNERIRQAIENGTGFSAKEAMESDEDDPDFDLTNY